MNLRLLLQDEVLRVAALRDPTPLDPPSNEHFHPAAEAPRDRRAPILADRHPHHTVGGVIVAAPLADGQSAAAIGPSAPDAPPLSPADIIEAFDADQVDCQFQPIVRITDGRPVGLEALARLEHPRRGTLAPQCFVPQVEIAGLSMPLTEAVIRRAVGGIDPGFLTRTAMVLTINLPLDALLLPAALALVETYRHAAGISAGHLLIELTESQPALDIPALAASLRRWRSAGYRLAIDDVSPDMVNQAVLFDLPFHVIKLDQRIVQHARTDPLAERYLQRIVAAARARALSVVAEGIEDAALWLKMRALGVDHAQGFLVARAMPAAALDGWLSGWHSRLRAER